MDITRRPTSLRHRAAWLLWLVLLVPVAQSVASWHGYSHVRGATSEHHDVGQAAQASSCDFCLAAAAVASGSLLAGEPGLAVEAGLELFRREAASSVWQELRALGYLSRASPHSAR